MNEQIGEPEWNLRPRVKVWLQGPDGFGFGSRFVAILEAVDRVGSIKHAAADVGWSYRHVWTRIKRAEASLGYSLVATQIGGAGKERGELTPAGRLIVKRFHELRGRLLDLAADDPDFGRKYETKAPCPVLDSQAATSEQFPPAL